MTQETDSTTASIKQVHDEVRAALTALKAKGIKDWQILDAWAQMAHQQGDYAYADTLALASIELGKPVE
jgi:hypothetical protein